MKDEGKRRKAVRKAAAAALAFAMMCAAVPQTALAEEATSDYEALTMMTGNNSFDYSGFLDALHEAYPEVNISLVSYKGANKTEYSNVRMKSNDICDIFVTTYPQSGELQQENLLDLSGEDFITNINSKSLNDLSVDGAVYLVPTNLSLFGIYYNKTLFEEHGWDVPESLTELEELIPQIEEAGVKVSECSTQYQGSMFAYFFDMNAGDYITTLEGIQWMQNYLDGTATATGNLEGCVETFQKWIDLGMLYIGETPASDQDTVARFKEGNTAFLIANSNMSFYQNDDGTGDEYGLMPYLSSDGSNNIVITNVDMYFGLNKNLEETPEKLEDARKVMSFIASAEGQASMTTRSNTIAPLKNEVLDESSPIYHVAQLVDAGKSMGLIYSGWEDYVVAIGQSSYDLVAGEISGEEFLASLDQTQADVIAQGGAASCADVEENLSKEQAAQLVGAAFADAAGADCALISIGDIHGIGLENSNGVNAEIYAGIPLTQDVVSTFNPLGWGGTIQTMTLTGAQIKAWAEEGYYCDGDETPFAYVLVTKDGAELEDDTEYTVACVKESEERAAEANLTDTGIVGQEALVEYITGLGTLNADTVQWK